MSPRTPSPDQFLPLTPVAFEILLAAAEGEPRLGYDIMLAIERRTGGRLSPNPGTLYRAIDRLVRLGLLDAVERSAPDGEVHRFYRLSKLGARTASAEAARLADQVSAARARRLLKKAGAP